MKCSKDIQELSQSKLDDVECLFKNGRFDAAFYLGGYVIELLFKAKVCKTLAIENFFDDGSPLKKLRHEDTYKVHNLQQLLILSGLYSQLSEETENVEFKKHWSYVCEWQESSRYIIGKTEAEVRAFITSIKVIKSWIEKFL